MNLPFLLCWLWLWGLAVVSGQAQTGYQASWRAGLLGLSQNPAAILAAPQPAEWMLGSAALGAQNNLFETNQLEAFGPQHLVEDLSLGAGARLFLPPDDRAAFRPNGQATWQAQHRSHFQGPGGAWGLETDPDWVERGVMRRMFALGLEREEHLGLKGLDRRWALGMVQGWPEGPGTAAPDAPWSLRVQEWDALAAHFGLTLGRGNKLLHLAVGAKLLSVGAFTDVQVHGSQLSWGPGGQLGFGADSLVWAYNPSFQRALSPGAPRRWNFFENSWGVAAQAGLVLQGIDYRRAPRWEIGLALHDWGAVQFWNLTRVRYRIDAQAIDPSRWARPLDVPAIESALRGLDPDTVQLGDGLTERLPLRLTAHGKFSWGDRGWGLQLQAQAFDPWRQRPWSGRARVTLCYERKRFGAWVPLSSAFTWPLRPDSWSRPQLGLYLALWRERLVLGSDDGLSNLFYAATRQGVRHSQLFIGLHVPLALER